MLKNYFKIAIRNLLKYKGFSFINIFGLAIGLAFCALIFLYVRDELTFDRFHKQADRIFQVSYAMFHPDGSVRFSNTNHPIPLGPALTNEIPEIAESVRLKYRTHYVRASADAIEENVLYADPAVLDVFTFPLQQGSPETALSSLNSVVLTESAAHKYFGNEDPIGKTLSIRLMQTFEPITVTAIAKDIPGNSTIQFDILLPFDKLTTAVEPYRSRTESWNFVSIAVYAKLAKQATQQVAESKLPTVYEKYYADHVAEERAKGEWPEGAVIGTYRLKPLVDIHLTSTSKPIYSFILSGIALTILLIACINFMILTIGRSASRAREIGMRKVVGARRTQLIGQFWGEAIILTSFALFLGTLLAQISLPVFNSLSGKTLQFDLAGDWTTIAMMVALVVLAGLAAGSYPAFVLSAFKPVETLKNRLRLKGSNALTKSLVVMQFALSVFLIISTLVMRDQLNYTRTKNLGYNKEQIVIIPTQGLDGAKVVQRFRNEIGNHNSILGMTATSNTLGNRYSSGVRFGHEGKTYDIDVYSVEPNYIDFLELKLVAGRNFNADLSSEGKNSVIVNESLVREMQIENPIGKAIPGYASESGQGPIIIGVVKDYNFQSLYQQIAPMLLTLDPDWDHRYILVRLHTGDIANGMALLRTAWQNAAPEVPFDYTFLDDNMALQYRSDRNWGRIVTYASIFAIMIACLGLLGLITLTVSARIKEVGIRKVLGASVRNIAYLLSRDFALLVFIAIVIAAPVAYFVMNKWLNNFAFRIEIGLETFFASGVVALILSILTVSYQTIKAGLTNPAETLRRE